MAERDRSPGFRSATLSRSGRRRARLSSLVAAAALALAAAGVARGQDAAGADAYDLVIRNGKVIDGAGNAWFLADVGVRGGRVAGIGDLSAAKAKSEIDAKGLVVAPGFIDVHTHADQDVFRQRKAENFIRDGVTTIINGNCGSSVKDVGEYFDRVRKEPPALNVATLIGHNTVRREVNGDAGNELSAEQIAKGQEIVRKAMEDGAVGFSTGLIYTPGTYAKTEEIIEFAKPSAKLGGIYVTHMRNEALKVREAIAEALRIGREAGCRVEISHFKVSNASEKIGGSAVTLKMVDDARAAGQEVWLDQYPYTASSTSITTVLPDWVMKEGRKKGLEILQDPDAVARVIADMQKQHEGTYNRKDMSYIVVANHSKHPEYAGKSVKTITQINKYKKQAGEAGQGDAGGSKELLVPANLPDVTMEEQYRQIIQIAIDGGAGAVFHSMIEPDIVNIMKHPLVSVCSDAGIRTFGQGAPHPRGYGSNARVLGRYVREQRVITLEDAVRKMTGLPATAFRLTDRGLLKPGYWADVVVFDPATVVDNATFDKPHAYSTGFRAVIVNGQVVVDDDTITDALPGMPVPGPGLKTK